MIQAVQTNIGAHVSTAGGLDLSFDRAMEIGATCTQIFLSPPQQWRTIDYPENVITKYLAKLDSTGIGPNFVHGIYLINLASDNPDNLQKSINWLIWSQKTCTRLKLSGTNFHLGSHGGKGFSIVVDKVQRSLSQILEKSPGTNLILENAGGGAIGGRFSEIGTLIKSLKDQRLKVCIDTQHAFASGYNLRTKEGLEQMLEEVEREIGLKNVVMIHANDSKTELGSGRDRHENIGEGLIGKEGFKLLLNHPKLCQIPFILEVPGFTNSGPDAENIQILKSLAQQAAS